MYGTKLMSCSTHHWKESLVYRNMQMHCQELSGKEIYSSTSKGTWLKSGQKQKKPSLKSWMIRSLRKKYWKLIRYSHFLLRFLGYVFSDQYIYVNNVVVSQEFRYYSCSTLWIHFDFFIKWVSLVQTIRFGMTVIQGRLSIRGKLHISIFIEVPHVTHTCWTIREKWISIAVVKNGFFTVRVAVKVSSTRCLILSWYSC